MTDSRLFMGPVDFEARKVMQLTKFKEVGDIPTIMNTFHCFISTAKGKQAFLLAHLDQIQSFEAHGYTEKQDALELVRIIQISLYVKVAEKSEFGQQGYVKFILTVEGFQEDTFEDLCKEFERETKKRCDDIKADNTKRRAEIQALLQERINRINIDLV